MPKERNDNDFPVFWNGKCWEPGDEHEVLFFVPAAVGLTRTSDLPKTPPLVLAGGGERTVEAGTPLEIEIPYPVVTGRVKVSVLPGTGSCNLFLGDGSVAIPINSGKAFLDVLPWERCPSLRLESADGATAIVLVTEEV